ncbi:MAG: ATP-binding protein [Candidatus Omnitrophica bacterium]|nr:ATP-binding protein [Candidatus Omnitrophota bacterium]MDD5671224.1 ATP-binding protein [Candidatus Omnitrophota bacterium]
MISFRSAKFRITLWYACILTVILLSFSFFMYSEFARALYRDSDETLVTEVQSLAVSLEEYFEKALRKSDLEQLAELSLNSSTYPPEIRQKLVEVIEQWERKTQRLGRSTLILRLVGIDHSVILGNLKSWERKILFPAYERDAGFMENGESFQTIHFEQRPIRLFYYLLRYRSRPLFIIQCGKSLHELEGSLRQLVFIIVISIPFAVLLACLAGWFLAKRSFRSVDHMIGKARKITAAYLKERLPRTHAGDELDRLAETLNEMMNRLETSTNTIKEFSSDVSHELKTPLAIIRGEIDLALRKTRSSESLTETLRVIGGEVDELIRLVDDLILLVRSDAKQLHLEMVGVSLNEILKQVQQRFDDRARAKHIALTMILDRECTIQGDALYLKRLFSNLVDNAIKFTNAGGNVLIHLNSTPASKAVIDIADDGIGIEIEMQEKVFSRFYRTDQARSEEGAGLGLNIAKAICEAHHGHIRIQSQPGSGTSVSVELPIS